MVWTRVVGTFTAVLAAVAVIQALAFIATERAFVIETFRLGEHGIAVGEPLQVIADVGNTGRGPAYITEVNLTPLFATKLPAIPEYQPQYTQTGGSIGSGGTRSFWFNQPDLVDEFNFNGIKDGSLKLFAFGYIRFSDEFSFFGPRTIGFCVVYDPQNGSVSNSFSDCQGTTNYVYSR